MTKHIPALEPCFLGIECGATSTMALLVNGRDTVLGTRQAGPANVRLLTDRQLRAHFRTLAWPGPLPTALAVGMAGARTDHDRARIRRAAADVWPGVACYPTNDLETALLADDPAPPASGRRTLAPAQARVLVLSGTGSCCFGRTALGRVARVGGWGHFLGDRGSGYDIGLSALKKIIAHFDQNGAWPQLGARLLRTLQLNEPDELIGWVQTAPKNAVAALAIEVFASWAAGDKLSRQVLSVAAERLAADAIICARKLSASKRAHFILAGSVFLKQPRFARWVQRLIRRQVPQAQVTPLPGPASGAQFAWRNNWPVLSAAALDP